MASSRKSRNFVKVFDMLDTFSKELYVHQCIFLHALEKSGLFLRVRRTSQHFFSAGGGGDIKMEWP